MSWNCTLLDPVTQEPLHAETRHFIAGGIYAQGGDTALTLNVTYNYAQHLSTALGNDFKALNGKTGAESIPWLTAGIEKLGNDTDADYWKPTEGNAKRALCGLRALAQMRPDGVWAVT